jgi:Na+/alanine symporter
LYGGKEIEPVKLLTDFVYLQLLDILTTLAFLMQGVAEGNPFVRWMLSLGENPIQSLIIVKSIAVVLAAYCVVRSRHRVLRIANIFFAILVAYNLIAIILAAPALNS